MGEHVDVKKAKESYLRYYLRTSKSGGDIGDTSNLPHYKTDFIYDRDQTCAKENSHIRKTFKSNH